MKPETMAIHVPSARSDGGAAETIQLSTTFEHGPSNELIHGYLYSRHGNPNVTNLETRLAALDGGLGAVAFASGIAAGIALMNTLPAGATIIFHDTIYFDFLNFARTSMKNWGLKPKIIDCRDDKALRAALTDGAALVWFETPANPTMDIIDIRAVAALAAEHGAKTLVDGTFATPALQQPLDLGVDYVLHSLTKYMGGHSDVQGGAIVVRDDDTKVAALDRIRKLTGGVLAPFNAWLISRGLHTLHCRMEKHCSNALAIAEMLESHPAVDRVRYPFLSSSPDFEIAKSQMSSGGGMLSFDVKGGSAAAIKVGAGLRIILNATSLGGTESLIEHRKSLEGDATTTPDNLLRLSVGLEHVDDLIADLEAALESR